MEGTKFCNSCGANVSDKKPRMTQLSPEGDAIVQAINFSLGSKMDTLGQKFSNLESKVQTVEDRAEEAHTRIDDHDKRLDALETAFLRGHGHSGQQGTARPPPSPNTSWIQNTLLPDPHHHQRAALQDSARTHLPQ